MVESFIFYNCILICSLSKAVYSVQYISLSSYLDQHDIFQVICLTGGLIDPLHDTFENMFKNTRNKHEEY